MQLVQRFDGARLHAHVYAADAMELLASLKDESSDLLFLDPPFNLNKKYTGVEKRDRRPTEEYGKWLDSLLAESIRVLAPGGALFIYHLPFWAMRLGASAAADLEFRHWIAVSMKNGFVRGRRLYPAHYALLYLTKGEPQTFKRPKIRPSRCRHCGDLIKDYGGYWPVIRKKGLNLGDVWDDLSPVRHAGRKNRDANELPMKLAERVIEIAGRRNKLYVDPFCGSGTGVLAAASRGMQILAGDLSVRYAALTARRLDELKLPAPRRGGNA